MGSHSRTYFSALAVALAFGFGTLGTVSTASAASKIFSAIVNANGSLARGTGGAKSKRIKTGLYGVSFKAMVSNCTYVGTVGFASPIASFNGQGGNVAVVAPATGNAKAVQVGTGKNGKPTDRPFHLLVFCP